jgi:hypothetical protein
LQLLGVSIYFLFAGMQFVNVSVFEIDNQKAK